MKKILFVILIALASACTFSAKAQTVFQVKYVTDADVTFFQTDSLHADLIAYQLTGRDSATGNTGLMYFTPFANEATKRVFYVAAPGDSIVSIYFSSSPAGTGWLNGSKSFLLN